MKLLALAWMFACGLVWAAPASAAPAEGQAAAAGGAGAAAAPRAVSLPHALRDGAGRVWNVDAAGAVSDGNGELYDGSGQLSFDDADGTVYGSPAGAASFDEASNTLVFPPVPYQGLNVSRRVGADARGGWCRFVEVLENPTGRAVRARLRLEFSFSNGVQGSQPITDERQRDKPAVGMAVFDGNDAVAMIGAGRGGRVVPAFSVRQDEGYVDYVYDVEVPPKQTVAIVHVQARLQSFEEATGFLAKTPEKDLLRGLPPEVARHVANFARRGMFVGDVEVLRGDILDVVELRGGDRYRGTIRDKTYKLRTAYGPVELPDERVVAMVTAGRFRPSQLLVTDDGQIFSGELEAGSVRLELSSGQVTALPLANVTRLGYRRREREAAAKPDDDGDGDGDGDGGQASKLDKPLVLLSGGDRIAVDLPAGPLVVATRYGRLELPTASIASIDFQGADRDVHDVRLTDGSHFAGLVAAERFDFKRVSLGVGKTLSLPAALVARLQFAAEAPADPAADAAVLSLRSGDVLVGALAGRLVVETGFDAIELDAAEIRSLRPGDDAPPGDGGAASLAEVQLELWDGATLSGRLRGDAVSCAMRSGPSVAVPVSLVAGYEQPRPRPPAQVVGQVKRLVADLVAEDAKRRDRAESELADLGPGIVGVLKELRSGQPPAVQERIDTLVAGIEADTKPKTAVPPVQPEPQGEVDVEEAPADVMPDEMSPGGEIDIEIEDG